MRFFGFEIARAKAAVPATTVPTGWDSKRGWWPIVSEPFTGAWQRNMEFRTQDVLAYSAVYACVTLIAADIGKLRVRLVEQDSDLIWSEINSPAFSPVLRKPNRWQNRIKFFEQWCISKLLHGNTYVLKERDGRGVVVALYILDPCRVKVLVAPDGAVFYQVTRDYLSGVVVDVAVPASEIIHDTMVPLYHPLCGVSPITACGMAALQGLSIQGNSTKLFQNGGRPGGILTSDQNINDETARRLKEYWDQNFTGDNAGKVAVVGDGLKYESLSINAVDSQLIEQLKWTAETVCSCFHVPSYMIGVGTMPNYNNIEALNQQYYTQCLQNLIESIELCLDEGLGLTEQAGKTYGTEFDLDTLLRMDTATKVKTAGEGVKAGIFSPNEARAKFDLTPKAGGDTPYLQQQNFSLAALDKRDTSADPFSSSKPAAPSPDNQPPADGGSGDNQPPADGAAGDGVNANAQSAGITDLDIHQQIEDWRQHYAEAA
jgi:HK97 family phage portal protein